MYDLGEEQTLTRIIFSSFQNFESEFAPNRQQQKNNIEALRSSDVADAFSSAFSSKLNESPIADTSSINEQWTQLKSNLNSVAVQTIFHVRKPHKNPWFDEEYRLLIEKKNEAW
jgi:hypothetical protein